MEKYLDKKVILNILFFIGLLLFSFHYKDKIDNFDKNYMLLTQNSYELDLQSEHLKNILKESIIHIRFNNDAIINKLKTIKNYILQIQKDSQGFKEYQQSFLYIDKYYEELKHLEQNIYLFMRFNAQINNSLVYLQDQLMDLEIYEEPFREKLLLSFTTFINLKYAQKNDTSKYKEIETFFNSYQTNDPKQIEAIKHITQLTQEMPRFKEVFFNIENSSLFGYIEEFKNSIKQEGRTIQDKLQQQFWIFIIIFVLSSILFIYFTIKSKQYNENIFSLIKENEKNLRYDRLTNTLSRAAFNEDEKNNKLLKSILIDIKQFNKINSMIGYEGGDYILQKLALTLKSFGEVYRVGADKFIINIDKTKDHIAIALEVHETIQNLDITYKGFTLPINVNIGITDTQPMIKTAELAISSNTGNNEVINIYNTTMDDSQSAKQNIEMLKKVNQALKDDLIRPFFQPIVSLESKQTIKYESLVRLIDGEKALSPYFFLDITKGSSTYQSITKTVLKKAMELVKRENIEVTINISFEDIEDQNTMNYINFFLMTNKEYSHLITFEILESEHISNFQIVENFIKMVKKHNCSIAIDDFGSGYSNFEYLFKLEPDIVKIDGSLIKDIHTNEKSRIIVESILGLAKKSHIKTVAEFVDNKEVDKIITDLGIDFAQGYYYSPPKDLLK